MSCGSSAIERASATRRAMPPESSVGVRCAAPRRPTALSFIITRSCSSSCGSAACSRRGKATFSYTDMSVNSAPNWNSIPILPRMREDAGKGQYAVRVRALAKRYARVLALDGVDLDIARGEAFGLIGANGAGKTTLIRCLLDLVACDAGRIELFGVSARAPQA